MSAEGLLNQSNGADYAEQFDPRQVSAASFNPRWQ
jgi:hypothetical protein